jgi:hypothetical protein
MMESEMPIALKELFIRSSMIDAQRRCFSIRDPDTFQPVALSPNTGNFKCAINRAMEHPTPQSLPYNSIRKCHCKDVAFDRPVVTS